MCNECQDNLEFIEQEEFDGNNDVYINSFWVCGVCGESVEPEESYSYSYDDYKPLDRG